MAFLLEGFFTFLLLLQVVQIEGVALEISAMSLPHPPQPPFPPPIKLLFPVAFQRGREEREGEKKIE